MPQAPLNIVGSSTFGRYPKISLETTLNMYESQGWLINTPGYKAVIDFNGTSGRGLYYSVRGDFFIAIVDAQVIRVNNSFEQSLVGLIETYKGEVTITENLGGQICIVDGVNAYIYNWKTKSAVVKQTLAANLIPNYVRFHNTFFLIGNNNRSGDGAKWYVYQEDTSDNTLIELAQGGEQALENKPDTALAVVPIPGGGNNVMVMGRTVGALFNQVGGLQNYRRVSSSNLDYGVVSVNTIAASDETICWLAQNENNAPTIMFTKGGEPNRISSDGIDHLLDSIQRPDMSTAFFFRFDGHLFYVLSFFAPEDNISLMYDFTAGKFYNLSDEKQNYFPFRQVIYFQHKIYGITLNDAKLYEISTDINHYSYDVKDDVNFQHTIPRLRITQSIHQRNSEPFFLDKLNIWLEQGHDTNWSGIDQANECTGYYVTEDGASYYVSDSGSFYILDNGSCLPYKPRVDVSISKNGGQSFTLIKGHVLNTQGHHKNIFNIWKMGRANEVMYKFEFWMRSRTVAGSGLVEMS